MKTADLIPLILIELSTGNKYGFELTKAIEDKSNQKIQIKQPTLYTVLKKLEKSKFISSYWEDSEIGGKRHYYKITENGKAQLSTLPSFDVCVKNILMSEQEENDDLPIANENIETNHENTNFEPVQTNNIIDETNFAQNQTNQSTDLLIDNQTNNSAPLFDENQPKVEPIFEAKQPAEEEKSFSIMDLIADNAAEQQTPIASVVNPTDVFASNDIDNKTTVEMNKMNSSFLKDETKQNVEQFAENKNVAKFVEKSPAPKAEFKDFEQQFDDLNAVAPKISNADLTFGNVKYVDYVDFKTKKEYIKAKRFAKGCLIKTILTAFYSFIMLFICLVGVKNNNISAFYYIAFTLGVVCTLMYLYFGIAKNDDLRLKVQNGNYSVKLKQRTILAAAITLLVVVISVISSISIGNNTLSSIFSSGNFANLYAPILIVTPIWIDLLAVYMVNKTTK